MEGKKLYLSEKAYQKRFYRRKLTKCTTDTWDFSRFFTLSS